MTSKKDKIAATETPKEETTETDTLKDTDTLPSEANEEPTSTAPVSTKEEKPAPKKKTKGRIIGLMGVEHQEGPPGSTHG